jgi:hypothetical protein
VHLKKRKRIADAEASERIEQDFGMKIFILKFRDGIDEYYKDYKKLKVKGLG